MTWIFFLNQKPGSCSFFQLINCFAMCTLQLIRAETSIQYSSQISAIVHNDNQMIIFLFMLLLFIFRPIYMYIYILLKTKWTFWALPDSIKWHENQAEDLSWNLVPRPISILCSPDITQNLFIYFELRPRISINSWRNQCRNMKIQFDWLSARLQYLQCISNEDTAVFH